MPGSEIGPYLRTQLAIHKISLRNLGRLAGIDPATLSRIVNGKQRPTLSHLERLSSAFAVPLEELLSASGYKTTEAAGPGRDVLGSFSLFAPHLTSEERWRELNDTLGRYRLIAATPEGKALIMEDTLTKLQASRATGWFSEEVNELYTLAINENAPPEDQSLAGSALLYFILESDVIPDDHFPIGYVDDAVAVHLIWEQLFQAGQRYIP